MNYAERALAIACAAQTLVGVLAQPGQSRRTGVLVLVGGPQYRAGSHRQFVLLSRRLAEAGYPVLRFDYRGTGDSTGDPAGFEAAGPDIAAALDTLVREAPGVEQVVLWGLCDAASAALLDHDSRRNPLVAGYCLLNPWVRSDASLARTQVRHYYGQRLVSADFWKKLLKGKVGVGGALRELAGKLRIAAQKPCEDIGGPAGSSTDLPFQSRMARALWDFPGRVLLVLSGKDFTAREFLDCAHGARDWRGLLERENLTRVDIADADHTFSTARWREQVEQACLDWLARIDDGPTPARAPRIHSQG